MRENVRIDENSLQMVGVLFLRVDLNRNNLRAVYKEKLVSIKLNNQEKIQKNVGF